MRYSSVADARAYLEKLIARAMGGTPRRLPPARKLARDAGVAESTLLKAVRALREEGVLEVSHGKGIRIVRAAAAPAPPAKTAKPHEEPRWRQVARAIYTRIARGEWQTMPSVKELRGQLGASHPTLRRALDCLVRDGVLEPHKRTYRVCFAAPPSRANTVVLISRGIDIQEMAPADYPHRAMAHELEYCCSRRRIKLKPVSFHYRGADLHGLEDLRRVVRDDWVLGYIICAEGVDRGYLTDTLRLLRDINRPVALFTRGEWWDLSSTVQPRLTRIYAPSIGPAPGHALMRYLLTLGHHSVAYVDELSENNWSDARLRGVREELRLAGAPSAVTHLAPLPTHPCPTELGRFCNRAELLTDEVVRHLRQSDDMRGWTAHHLTRIQGTVNQVRNRIALRAAVSACLDRVLATPEVTCVVGANDRIALACLEGLRERGIDVPGRLSVAGFDNSMESFVSGLTSYDFGFAELFRRMLFFVLQPNNERYYVGKSIVAEHQGTVVPRTTTAPPARR